jgi:hypothetical protein
MAALDSKRHRVVIFGGVGAGSEVWFFSLDSQMWQQINPPNGHASYIPHVLLRMLHVTGCWLSPAYLVESL